MHNHFAVNSVSFRDGGKYNSCKAATQRLRDVSDRLCREYGLSVIMNPGKSPHRKTYLAEKNGEPTKYNVFRQAIDRAIAASMTPKQFGLIMRSQGFEMKQSGKYWTIRIIGDNRATRTFRLGENYTEKAIMDRIYGDGLAKRAVRYEKPKLVVSHRKLNGNFRQMKKHKGFRALYFYFLYRMGVLPKNKPRPPSHPILWEDVRQIRKYSRQAQLLAKNKIDTAEQLQAFVDSTQNRMDDLVRQRTQIQNKLRRAKEPEVIEALKVQKTTFTEHITPLRRDLAVAREIEEQTAKMKKKLAIIRALELQENTKQHQP